MGRKHGSVTPDDACTSHIGGGLVFEGRPVRALFNHQIELGRDHNWQELYQTYSTSYRDQCSYSQFLDGMQAASARGISFDNIGYHDLNVRLSGDSAYLTYVATYNGEDVSSADSSAPDIYVRENGRWYDEVDSHTQCD